MVNHIDIIDRDLLVIHVKVPNRLEYFVHIQIDEVTVFPIGRNKTRFHEVPSQKECQIKHIIVGGSALVSLSEIPTCDLVDELVKREGVSE